MRYRKIPVEIEAVQWTGKNIGEIDEFTGGKALWYGNLVAYYPLSEQYRSTILTIPTLEGNMQASIGDYIIKGINGEFYPCKPDIFKKMYEPIHKKGHKKHGER